jgi:hypothetical protein
VAGDDQFPGDFKIFTRIRELLGLLGQFANVGSTGGTIDEKGSAFVISAARGIEPKDQVEAMLAAQMAAIHNATRTFARRLAHVENISQQDSASRALNQLTRTFAAQVEALKRYRTGGQQQVVAKHVTVNEGGGRAIGAARFFSSINRGQSARNAASRQAADGGQRHRHRVHLQRAAGLRLGTASTGATLRRQADAGFIESFNGRLRDELLNETPFPSQTVARVILANWPVATTSANFTPGWVG